jgi:DNA-directed RNA polymerase subunit RPC12/RpoP
MSKNRIALQDGTIDLSGDYAVYDLDRIFLNDKRLPYTVHDVMKAPTPKGFIKFLESDFAEAATAETLIYYLSLIPAMETGLKYGGVFYGGAGTGKTAVLEIMREIFPGYFINLPVDVLAIKKARHIMPSEKTFCIAELENRGAGIVQEFPADYKIDSALWKVLTGGDTITARWRYGVPHEFIPTAQIIIVTNHILSFAADDEVVKDRLLLFPFLKKHGREEPETKTFNEIVVDLKPEFPGIVHLLADRFIHLKRKLNGKIPQSAECRSWKKAFLKKGMPALPSFYFCENCQKIFSWTEILVENNQPHCPRCSSIVKEAQAHVSRRGGGYRP